MKHSLSAAALSLTGLAVLYLAPAAQAQVNVDLYSGISNTPTGAPYSHYVGSFTSPDIQFGTDTGFNWHPLGLTTNWGADLTGFLTIPTTGSYTFSLDSDDGSQLFIDHHLVVDDGGSHGATLVSDSATLTAGNHLFEVQFEEILGGGSGLDLNLPPGVSYLTFTSSVPEPGACALLGSCGLAGAALLRRKRSR